MEIIHEIDLHVTMIDRDVEGNVYPNGPEYLKQMQEKMKQLLDFDDVRVKDAKKFVLEK